MIDLKTRILPLAYYLLEYILSSGTLYIDIGVPPTPNNKVITRCQILTDIDTNAGIIGGQSNESGPFFQYCWNGNVDGWIVQWGSTWHSYGTKDNNWHTHIMDIPNKTLQVDNNTYNLLDPYTAIGTRNLYVFATNNIPSVARLTSMKMEYLKLYDNNILQRNLIPAQRKSDNVVGMYDLVTDTFYTNSGTGNFTAGPIIKTVDELVINKDVKELSMNSLIIWTKAPKIPSKYQEVEYIKNSYNSKASAPYINTGIKPNPDGKVIMKFNRESYGGQSNISCIFGAYDSNSRNFGLCFDTSTIYWMYGSQSNAGKSFPLQTDYDLVFDGLNKTFTLGTFTQSFSSLNMPTRSNLQIYLFTNNAVGSLVTYDRAYTMVGKIYSFEYYENNVLLNKLVPCKRKSDSKPGMYDLVNDVFYINQGTGDDFTVGPDVN